MATNARSDIHARKARKARFILLFMWCYVMRWQSTSCLWLTQPSWPSMVCNERHDTSLTKPPPKWRRWWCRHANRRGLVRSRWCSGTRSCFEDVRFDNHLLVTRHVIPCLAWGDCVSGETWLEQVEHSLDFVSVHGVEVWIFDWWRCSYITFFVNSEGIYTHLSI